MPAPYLIDSHCHLHDTEWYSSASAEEALVFAHNEGVQQIIVIGTDPEDSAAARAFAATHPGVFWTYGIHPEHAEKYVSEPSSSLSSDRASRQPAIPGATPNASARHPEAKPRDASKLPEGHPEVDIVQSSKSSVVSFSPSKTLTSSLESSSSRAQVLGITPGRHPKTEALDIALGQSSGWAKASDTGAGNTTKVFEKLEGRAGDTVEVLKELKETTEVSNDCTDSASGCSLRSSNVSRNSVSGCFSKALDAFGDSPIAIGEIGLDYHYSPDTKTAQIKLFEQMLQLARDLSLPVSLHIREAFPDAFGILNNFPDITGVVHSFTGSKKCLRECLNRGFYIGVNGLATYSTLPMPPLDRILLETDAPFLTPAPKRGIMNTPGNVRLVAAFLAEQLGVAESTIAEQTTTNVKQLFHLPDF